MSDYKLTPEEEKMKEAMDLSTPSSLPEAPASASVKIKSARGFEYIFTIRDEKASVLMFKIAAMEEKWVSLGWTPLTQNQPYKRNSEDVSPPAPIKPVAKPDEEMHCQICGYPMDYREGMKSGKKWKAWFCSTGNKSHPPMWI
jgi:hypothetical protein